MMINSKRDFLKDIDRIRSLSSVIDKKLSEMKPSDSDKIDKLTLDELQDLDKIAGIADFMLTKYADKKEMCSILKNFTSVITDTAASMGNLDDEISELSFIAISFPRRTASKLNALISIDCSFKILRTSVVITFATALGSLCVFKTDSK